MFAAILAAQFFSLLGQEVLQFVLPLYLLGQTGSASLFGMAVAVGFVLYTLLAPVGGVVADRTAKRGVLLAVNAALIATLAIFLVAMGHVDTFALVALATAVPYAAQALFQPAIQSSVPFVLAGDDVPRGVSLVSQIGMLTTLAGPVLGAFVYGLVGVRPVVAVSIGAFAISFVLVLAFVRLEAPVYEPLAGTMPGEGRAETRATSSPPKHTGALAVIRADIAQALAFLKTQPLLMGSVVMAVCVNLVAASFINVGTAYIVTVTLGLTALHTSIAQAAIGAGGIAGSALVVAVPRLGAIRYSWIPLLVGMLGMAGLAAVLVAQGAGAFSPTAAFVVHAATYALVMAACTLISVSFMAELQTRTPEHLVGKMVALFMALANCATPLGQVIYGFCFDAVPASALAAATAVLLLLVTLAWRRFLRRLSG